MARFRNLKIKNKLILSFVVFAVFIYASVIIGSYGIHISSINTKSLYSDHFVAVHDLDKVKENLLKVNCDMLKLSTGGYTQEKFQLISEIGFLQNQNVSLLIEYEKKDAFPIEKKIYNDFKKQFEEYNSENTILIGLVQGNEYEKAKKSFDIVSISQDKVLSSLDQIIDANTHYAQEDNESNGHILFYFAISMGTIAILALIAAHVMGKRISRHFSSEFNKILIFAKNLASGNLNETIEISSMDEFGVLSNALNIAAANTLGLTEKLKKNEDTLESQVQELRDLELKLRTNEERYRLALEGSNDGLWDINYETREVFITDKSKDILGIEAPCNIFKFEDWNKTISSIDVNILKDKLDEYIEDKRTSYHEELSCSSGDNQIKHILARGRINYDSLGNVSRILGSFADITEKNLNEEKIRFLAYNNSLTKLPNRTYFKQMMPVILNDVSKRGMSALYYLDFDNFKNINDTLGHEVGDELLIMLSGLFKEYLSENDFVFHLGGDEFAFFTPDIEDIEFVKSYAKGLLDVFTRPFSIQGHEIITSASVGIAIYPGHGSDYETLLKNADAAMYQAKYSGKNRFRIFTQEMNEKISEKVELEKALYHALDNNEFKVYYQPKVDIRTNRLCGMEALVRWMHPEKGIIQPDRFIPLAEETGVITKIGEIVLRTACIQNKFWQEIGLMPVKVAVNLSAKQLRQRDIIERITCILDETGLDPEWLELEITESVVMHNLEHANKIFSHLQGRGISISLDDFGTGYSSLNYLRLLSINSIKIDKSFMDEMMVDTKNNFIVSSLINLARGMELRVVAEGVETMEQYLLLKQYDCDEIQGFLFSKPLPPKEFEELLKSGSFKLHLKRFRT